MTIIGAMYQGCCGAPVTEQTGFGEGSAAQSCSCGGPDAVSWDEVADHIVRTCARVTEGEVVQLGGGTHAFPLLEALALAVRRAGAFPELNVTSQRLLSRTAGETPLEYLARTPEYRIRWLEDVDAVIATDTLLDPHQLPALSMERQEALAAGWGPVDAAMAERGVRSLYVPFPSAMMAARFGLSGPQFQRRVYDSLDVDYAALAERGSRLAERLAGARQVRIGGPGGAELTMSWDVAYVDVSDGLLSADPSANGPSMAELPAGAVTVTPVNGGNAEGTWSVPTAFWEHHKVDDVTIDFARGRVDHAEAPEGDQLLKALLFQGKRRSRVVVGRIAFGFNPKVTEPTGYSLLDSRLDGSVTLILQQLIRGEVIPGMGLEWPLVLPQASVWLDGEPVLTNGRWLM